MTYAHRRARLVSISVPNNPTRIGVKPRVYRSPYWDFSPNTLSILEEYGFSADSSLMGNDFHPYVIGGSKYMRIREMSSARPARFWRSPCLGISMTFPRIIHHWQTARDESRGRNLRSMESDIRLCARE